MIFKLICLGSRGKCVDVDSRRYFELKLNSTKMKLTRDISIKHKIKKSTYPCLNFNYFLESPKNICWNIPYVAASVACVACASRWPAGSSRGKQRPAVRRATCWHHACQRAGSVDVHIQCASFSCRHVLSFTAITVRFI